MSNFVALNNKAHKNLTIDPAKIEAQGARENMAPVVISEFLKLVVQYPIAFTKNAETGRFVCVALFGFAAQENLFWQNDQWHGIYTPLNIRRQPFFIGEEHGNNIICIDTDSSCLTNAQGDLRTAEKLFDAQGEETEYLVNAREMLAELVDGEKQTYEFIQTLLELKLIMPMSLDITFANQKQQQVQGLYTIDEDKLENLTSDALQMLQQKHYLKPIYIMTASLGHIYSLIQKKNERK
ncbi:MAG: SapC family protein [Pseudomonadota bacterium]